MAPIRYSLHYEDYSEHMMSRFGKLLQMQSLVDMTLMCSSHTLRVHKAVLAACSAYFQEVLQKQTGEPLIILNMRFGVMKCLVEFMYCGKTQCPEEYLDELVSAAQFLKIKGLSKVTKEGLGINNNSELPVFTPPVVIDRPPQSLMDLHAQNGTETTPSIKLPMNSTSQAVDSRISDDAVLRIPFDIENKVMGGEYDLRSVRRSRGRPSCRQSGGNWEGNAALGRAAERALLRREQDSRKAIHHLKNLQSRQMQDYMDRTLSQAVSTICEPESNSNNYMNMDNDLIYMDRNVSPNVLDTPISFSKEHSVGNETITSSFTNASDINKTSNNGISEAMSQYVNVLKNAGLPTDLPILFESGDGSYINVNEQVLLDMVQSNEIQYEVIEQPNIIEKVADPSEIKSIDDLSKSIERGEMLMGSNNNYMPTSTFEKNIGHEDALNSLNSLLPDGLDSYNESQNYSVMGSGLQNNSSSMDNDTTNDFSCIDNDMQFFTKSMSEDVKKYYEDQPLSDSRGIDQLCPASTSLDTSFSMSLLDTKNSNLTDNISNQYNPLNTVRSDCYDFSLQLSQTSQFKEEDIDCLISSTKQSDVERTFDSDRSETRVQDQDEIMKDLIDLENKIRADHNETNLNLRKSCKDNVELENLNSIFQNDNETNVAIDSISSNKDFSPDVTADLQWDRENGFDEDKGHEDTKLDHTDSLNLSENLLKPEQNTSCVARSNSEMVDEPNDFIATPKEDIPFAVGLLPLKQFQSVGDSIDNICKRKSNDDDLCSVDAKCLKRKVKYKLVDNSVTSNL